MKSLTTILISACLVALTAGVANAQDDDDLFGGDDTGEDAGDITDDGTTDDGTSDDGMSDDGTSDTSGEDGAATEAATSGDVGKSSGTLGLGFSTTTNNFSGVEAEYWLSESLVVSALARLLILSGDNGDLTSFGLGGGALFVLKARGKAALLAGGRFLFGYASIGDASSTSIALEVPLRLQMALHSNISAHVEGGAAILIGDQAGLDPTNTAAGTIDFGFGVGTNNVYGQAGLTFYF